MGVLSNHPGDSGDRPLDGMVDKRAFDDMDLSLFMSFLNAPLNRPPWLTVVQCV